MDVFNNNEIHTVLFQETKNIAALLLLTQYWVYYIEISLE